MTKQKTKFDWNEVDWSDAALSSLDWARGIRGIVRPTHTGDFVLIKLDGRGTRKFVKRFQSLERARAYNFACAR